MKCPTCGENTSDAWEKLIKGFGYQSRPEYGLEVPIEDAAADGARRVSFAWMHCANEDCRQLVVRAHDIYRYRLDGDPTPNERAETWLVYPRRQSRPLDPLVAEEAPDLADDFSEAAAILEISPRMSAVLSRRILADLLERYANLTAYGVSDRIDSFRADAKHPAGLREHMHHFREIADFGAHTQRNDEDQIIDVDPAGAAWMLDYLERLFDYLIVSPAKDREITRQWDKNVADANRRPIKPLPLGADGEAHSEDAEGSGDSSPETS
jgi:hypothetical protein